VHRPRDTSSQANERYFEALRRLSPEQRLQVGAQLTEAVRTLTEAGVRSRHPEYTPEQVAAAMADILLGRELAAKSRRRGPVTQR
jgi:hypothetical protein